MKKNFITMGLASRHLDNTRIKMLQFTIILFAVFALTAGVQAAEHHVSSVTEANSVGKAGDIVYIAAGTYSQALKPANSGNSTQGHITYKPEGGTVTITGVNTGIILDGKSYINIDALRVVNVAGTWVSVQNGAHHITVQNCHMERTNGWSGFNIYNSNNIKILNNYIKAVCPCSGPELCDAGGPDDLLYIRNSHHLLIERNELYDGIHDNIDVQDQSDGSSNYIIIRDNYISNQYHGAIDNMGVEYMLVEGNVIADSGDKHYDNWCSRSNRDKDLAREHQRGIKFGNKWSIMRNNTFVNNGRAINLFSRYENDGEWKGYCVDNRIYNNTLCNNYYSIYVNNETMCNNNIIKNNIIYNNDIFAYPYVEDNNIDIFAHRIYDGQPRSENDFITHNVLGGKVQHGADNTETDIMSVNPKFASEANRNFNLASDSPMINRGAWLTTTNSAGSGSKIEVDDARYFMNGWGLVDGDLIQFEGQTQTYRVTDVDYSTNVITIDQNATWEAGAGISLPYSGSKPDLGAFEYGGTTTLPAL